MSGSKQLDRIAAIVTIITLLLTLVLMNGAALGIEATAHTIGYESRLFDQSRVHTLDIVMSDWNDMLDNAASEEYYIANVVIDGEAYKNVGIRTKGNTSLSSVATLGSERYSFKIEFDHYDSTKSYYGLDKLSLNNLIQDSTMMKDYLTYTMMNAFGVSASLCSYVYITVNGEDWGLYLAVEGVEDSFLARNYGSNHGALYKPDSTSFGGGRGNGGDFDLRDFDFGGNNGASDDGSNPPGAFAPSTLPGSGMPNTPSTDSMDLQEGSAPSDIPGGFDPSGMSGEGRENGSFPSAGGFGMGSSDVKLQYIDDEIDSYSNIWNNAKTDITEADQNRLIAALKKLSSYEDIASVVDVEQVIRYFVVHNYVCNGDSYTGSMVHNYYLYEKDGRLAMIPWDYNLAFGTFSGGNANNAVNTPVDIPLSGGAADRPMLNWIYESEAYTQLYHQYFSDFLRSVDTDEIIDSAYYLIKDYVARDPTAFYSYDAFELGVETLRQFCALRSESISMQLENNETTEDMGYVDASAITLSDMGSMGGDMGGAMPDMPGNSGDFNATIPAQEENDGDTMPDDFGGRFPSSGNTDIPSAPAGGGDESDVMRPSSSNMQQPNGNRSNSAALIWLAASVLVLAVGLIVAKKHP